LEQFFSDKDHEFVPTLLAATKEVPEASVAAARRDVEKFLALVIEYNLGLMGKHSRVLFPKGLDEDARYDRIKGIETAMVGLLKAAQRKPLAAQDSETMVALL